MLTAIVDKLTLAKKRHYILPVPFLILGVAFVFFGIYEIFHSRALIGRAIKVPGTITGTVKHTYGRDWRLSKFSRFRFKTLDGRIISAIDESPDDYKLGESITVLYDAQNPDVVYIDRLPIWGWEPTLICTLVGVFFLGAAILAWSGR